MVVMYVFKSKYSSTVSEVLYYKCNRSKDSSTLKGKDQRSILLKSQGSRKMNHSCTSEIKVTNENNKITVDWQKIHYGHDFEMQHIRIPKAEKQSIFNQNDTWYYKSENS